MTESADGGSALVRLSDSEFILENRTQDIRGLDVYDKEGEEIGTVEEFGAFIAAHAIPHSIFAVRLDIPGDRRGYFASLIREVRWEFDRAGFFITILKFDDEMKGYLAAPCDVVAGRPFWRGGSYGGGQRK